MLDLYPDSAPAPVVVPRECLERHGLTFDPNDSHTVLNKTWFEEKTYDVYMFVTVNEPCPES